MLDYLFKKNAILIRFGKNGLMCDGKKKGGRNVFIKIDVSNEIDNNV